MIISWYYMNTGVFIGVDLGTSIKRKSTGIASLVEKKAIRGYMPNLNM